MTTGKWRTEGVRVIRGQALDATMRAPGGTGRATVVDYSGSGGQQTWIGTVTLPPQAKTGAHHHGRHEVTIYVVKGRSEIRWGERLEYATEVGPGDFVYFAPFVPHQEFNMDADESVVFVVVRSDNEKIVVKLDADIVEKPEAVY